MLDCIETLPVTLCPEQVAVLEEVPCPFGRPRLRFGLQTSRDFPRDSRDILENHLGPVAAASPTVADPYGLVRPPAVPVFIYREGMNERYVTYMVNLIHWDEVVGWLFSNGAADKTLHCDAC